MAALARFLAHKSGNQTSVADVTWTVVTFDVEDFDIGSHFASNVWTPPAGEIIVGGRIYGSGTITQGKVFAIGILKNGVTASAAGYNIGYCTTNTFGPYGFSWMDNANGSDTYALGAYVDLNSGTGTIDSTAYFTNFWGFAL